METIIIQDLAVLYHIGVPDAERAKPQKLLITAEMRGDFSKACSSDELSDTIDYYDVCQTLINFGHGRSWKLLEHLAQEICSMILGRYRVQEVSIEIKKFIIPEARFIAVRLLRKR